MNGSSSAAGVDGLAGCRYRSAFTAARLLFTPECLEPMRILAILTLAVLGGAVPVDLAAQEPLVRATVDSGTLIRMYPTAGPYLRGRLIRPLTPTSTVIEVCRYPAVPCDAKSDSSAYQQVPAASLTRIEVQRGTRWETGTFIGGVVGAMLGMMSAGLANSMCEEVGPCASTWGAALIGATAVGAFGALIGSSQPDWAPAP